MEKVCAVIVAAGAGRRMRGVDKLFSPLAGKPLLAHTVEAFNDCPSIDRIVIAISQANLDAGQRQVEEHGWSKVIDVCLGGQRRQDSVREGLQRLAGCQWVLIHDGARPCVGPELIAEALQQARQYGAAIPAIPISDTIKAASSDMFVEETLPRRRLWAAQTPQAFRYDIISEAHLKLQGEVTDDAAAVEQLGYRVKLYPGDETNIKVTTPEDLLLAEAALRARAAQK